MRGKYIIELDDILQVQIKEKLFAFYREELELSDEEIEEELERAMNSRLGDLEDTIDVSAYLK